MSFVERIITPCLYFRKETIRGSNESHNEHKTTQHLSTTQHPSVQPHNIHLFNHTTSICSTTHNTYAEKTHSINTASNHYTHNTIKTHSLDIVDMKHPLHGTQTRSPSMQGYLRMYCICLSTCRCLHKVL